MNISRRSIVAGLAATPIAKTTASASTEDAELVALGEQFTEFVTWMFEQDGWSNNEPLLSRLGEIGTGIMETPATTMQGLVVKARIACFVQGSGLWFFVDPERCKHSQPGWPFALSIVVDLVRRYDPDLEWVSDLVASPERARHARAERESWERRKLGA